MKSSHESPIIIVTSDDDQLTLIVRKKTVHIMKANVQRLSPVCSHKGAPAVHASGQLPRWRHAAAVDQAPLGPLQFDNVDGSAEDRPSVSPQTL